MTTIAPARPAWAPLVLALLAAAPLSLPPSAPAQEAPAAGPAAEAEGVRVSDAWTVAGAGPSAEVYMRVENAGDAPVTIAGVEASIGGTATLVASPERSGGGVPETLAGLLMAPGMKARLAPEGLHVLISGLEEPRVEGQAFGLTLTLDPPGAIEVPVAVEAPGARGAD